MSHLVLRGLIDDHMIILIVIIIGYFSIKTSVAQWAKGWPADVAV